MMARLATPCSRDTLLRNIRRTAGRLSANTGDAPRVIGIDDFAWRRGHRYGSIVVDLERHTVIDILPDRERETIATWFRANRQVEVICRDRGASYGSELWRRLRAAGFAGGLRVVTEWATKRRCDEKTGQPAGASVSARSIARDMTSKRSSASARVAMVNTIVETASPALIKARSLMDQFHAMMRTRKPEKLAPWIAAAKQSNIAAFAAGIETDQAAVRAAIVEPWSSGQVEGQVTRLKLVKRQMYGRANLDLLKARLMGA